MKQKNIPQDSQFKECPACLLLTSTTPKVTFRRVNHHEHAYMLLAGYECINCGYLVKQVQII